MRKKRPKYEGLVRLAVARGLVLALDVIEEMIEDPDVPEEWLDPLQSVELSLISKRARLLEGDEPGGDKD